MRLEKKDTQRILAAIAQKTTPGVDGCLFWTGCIGRAGYGLISITSQGKRTTIPAHRAHYMAHTGADLVRGQYLCHTCDNRLCVNLAHLYLGNSGTNAADIIKRGRKAKEHRPHCRLRKHPNDVVISIRNTTGPYREIAEKYGVSIGYVSKIKRGNLKALV